MTLHQLRYSNRNVGRLQFLVHFILFETVHVKEESWSFKSKLFFYFDACVSTFLPKHHDWSVGVSECSACWCVESSEKKVKLKSTKKHGGRRTPDTKQAFHSVPPFHTLVCGLAWVQEKVGILCGGWLRYTNEFVGSQAVGETVWGTSSGSRYNSWQVWHPWVPFIGNHAQTSELDTSSSRSECVLRCSFKILRKVWLFLELTCFVPVMHHQRWERPAEIKAPGVRRLKRIHLSFALWKDFSLCREKPGSVLSAYGWPGKMQKALWLTDRWHVM